MRAVKRSLDPARDPEPGSAVRPLSRSLPSTGVERTGQDRRWFDRTRVRYGWVDLGVVVQRRFGAERGANLAAAISMRGFLALFPMLVLAIAVVGFIGGDRRPWPTTSSTRARAERAARRRRSPTR